MKVAFVVSHFPSLSETFILSQITGLIDQKCEVDIYARSPDILAGLHPDVEKYNLLKWVNYLPILPKKYPKRLIKAISVYSEGFLSNPLIILKFLSEFNRPSDISQQYLLDRCSFLAIDKLREKPYDIIHCHFAPNVILGWIIKMINPGNPKLGVTFHGNDVNSDIWIAKQTDYKPLIKDIDFYTANTHFTADKAAKIGFPREKISILPVGLNISKYDFGAPSIDINSPIRILTVARLVEKKGIEYSIRAIAKVIKTFPNVIYQIAGDGNLRGELEELVRQLGIQDKVVFLGWKNENEILDLYRQSHIFFLTSVTAQNGDMEGQGLVLQEAQAVGIPVISTLHNGIPDGVLDGETGFLVAERDVSATAEKIKYLIRNPQTWKAMGELGRAFVRDRYDIQLLNQKLAAIYQEVLKS